MKRQSDCLEENRLPQSDHGRRKIHFWLGDFGITRGHIALSALIVAGVWALAKFLLHLAQKAGLWH